MPIPKETPFEAWEFSVEEWPIAATFTELQTRHIKTELAVCATEKLMLAATPEVPIKYMLEQEFIRGKMEILSYLLTVSEEAKSAVQTALENAVASQKSDSQPRKT
jgi:hypothetical protein